MTDAPGFRAPVAPGHPGEIRSYRSGAVSTLVLLGRTHRYEGHGLDPVVHGAADRRPLPAHAWRFVEGVYAWLPGPHYETWAEAEWPRLLAELVARGVTRARSGAG